MDRHRARDIVESAHSKHREQQQLEQADKANQAKRREERKRDAVASIIDLVDHLVESDLEPLPVLIEANSQAEAERHRQWGTRNPFWEPSATRRRRRVDRRAAGAERSAAWELNPHDGYSYLVTVDGRIGHRTLMGWSDRQTAVSLYSTQELLSSEWEIQRVDNVVRLGLAQMIVLAVEHVIDPRVPFRLPGRTEFSSSRRVFYDLAGNVCCPPHPNHGTA